MEVMVKRIQLECRGKMPEDVKHLNLDCCRSTQICGLTDEFKNLETLSMIDNGLTTLKGFPVLPNLKKLELSDNRLVNGLEALQGCKKLSQLNLGGNRFKEISSLEPLKELPNLRNLDLFNCEVTSQEDYRKKVFELLPNLDVLDNFEKKIGSVVENNENEYGSDDDDEESDEEEEGEDGEDNYNYHLSYLEKSGLENESEGEDFVPGQDLSEDEIDEEDDDEDENAGRFGEGGGGGDDDDGGEEDDLDEEEEDNAEATETAEVTQASRKRKRPEGDDEAK